MVLQQLAHQLPAAGIEELFQLIVAQRIVCRFGQVVGQKGEQLFLSVKGGSTDGRVAVFHRALFYGIRSVGTFESRKIGRRALGMVFATAACCSPRASKNSVRNSANTAPPVSSEPEGGEVTVFSLRTYGSGCGIPGHPAERNISGD